MKEALSILCMLATPGREVVARMKARWAFGTDAACVGSQREYVGWFLVGVVLLGASRGRKGFL